MNRLVLPKIYPLTDVSRSGRSNAEQVAELINGGARFIQIREKSAPSDEFYRSVVECLRIAEATGTRIIVNDRVDIALAAGAHGVHLGQTDLPAAEARKLLGEAAIIGASTHNIEQLEEALRLPIDHVAIGPVFATVTKENPAPVIGLEMLKEARRIAGDMPLVAIGGINESNLATVFNAGADSAAVIGALHTPDIGITARYARISFIADNQSL